MQLRILLLVVVASLCNQVLTQYQCFTENYQCSGGGPTVGVTTFQQCCNPVLQQLTLERSFRNARGCFPCLVVGLENHTYLINESSTAYQLRLMVLSTANTICLRDTQLRLVGVAGTAAPDDFFVPTFHLSITGDMPEMLVPVTIFADRVAEEPVERFTVSVLPPTNPSHNDAMFLFRDSVINIVDADMARIGFENISVSVNEGSGFATLYVALLGTARLGRQVIIRFSTAVATTANVALASADYNSTEAFLNFSQATTCHIVQIPIYQDSLLEPTEQLTGNLTLVDNNKISVIVDPAQATVNITDDDAVIRFVQSSYSFSEADGTGTIDVILIGQVFVPITASVTELAPGSASFQVSFKPDVFNQVVPVNININNNIVLEDNIVRIFTLGGVSSLLVAIGDPKITVVTIRDDDKSTAVIRFVQGSYSFSEADGTGTIGITLVGQVSISVKFNVSELTPGSASFQVIFQPNVLNQVVLVNLTIFNNNIALEDDIVRTFTIGDVPSSLAVIGDPDTTVVTIRDDDIVTVGYDRSSYTFSEADGTVNVVLRISNPIASNFTIRPQGGPGLQSQYVVISGSNVNTLLLFTPTSSMSVNISMTINDDNFGLEDDEVYELLLVERDVRLSVGGGGLFAKTRITIKDDDDVIMTVSTAAISVDEGAGVVQVCAHLSQLASVPVTVTFDGQGISATEGADFTEAGTQLTIRVRSRQGCVTYNIIADNVTEGNETFNAVITGVTGGATIGSPSTTTVIIIDKGPTIITCTVSSNGLISAFTTDIDRESYRFAWPCEHALLTLCSTRVPADFGVFIDTTDGTIATAVVGVRLNGNTSIVQPGNSLGIASLGIIVTVSQRPNVSITITITNETLLQNECGLCGRKDGSLVLPNGNPINSSDDSDIEGFISAYKVLPGYTFLRDDRRECGILVNDSVMGDPAFTVPLLTVPGEDHTLCYEIHGRADNYFNFVSDTCVSVNAHYVERPNNRPGALRPLNIIDQIAVLATDSSGECVNITVNLVGSECRVLVGSQSLNNTGTSYINNRITIRSYRRFARIAVPNCENVRLWMEVYCEQNNGVDMIRYHVRRGYNLRPTSHGLIGQFWNIPAMVTRYTGPLRDGTNPNATFYIITLQPPNSPIRRVPALLALLRWDLSPMSCLYAGNSQGEPIYEVPDPNDSLIEGTYNEYRIDSAFATSFTYERFDEESCGNPEPVR